MDAIMTTAREFTYLEAGLRILMAIVLGGMIGMERGLKNRPAGLRTYMLVCLGAWLCTERTSFLKIAQVEPKYMLLGGAIGAFITYTVIRSMDALGPAKAVMLIVIAQLAVAYIIELFGWFGVEKQPWEWRKAVGMAVAIVGIIIFKWK